jgi:hypothetical protein
LFTADSFSFVSLDSFFKLYGVQQDIKTMTKKTSIQIFEEKKVRSVWNDDEEKWYFSVLDVVEVLTDSANPTDYFKKMRKRDPELAEYVEGVSK